MDKYFKYSIVLMLIIQIGWQTSNGAKILGVFPTPSISHQIVFRALMEELARRGHNLVVMTTDPVHYKEKQFENFTEIDVRDMSYKLWHESFNFVEERDKDPSPMGILSAYYDIMLKIADIQLDHPEIKKLIENPDQKFDLCIVEGILPLYTLLKDHFGCPLIQINSFTGVYTNFENTGSPTHPTIYYDIMNPYDLEELDTWKRFQLLIQRLTYHYYNYWKYSGPYNKLAKKHFGEGARSIEEAQNDIDMVFLNVHPVISGARPIAPTIINMGSMHILPYKPPPSNIQNVLNAARNGAIYFSLGSNVRSCDLPEGKVAEILQVIKSLPYTVLWKWENDTLANKPDNVFISKWFPQQSILGHKNIKLFITQGGQQSMEESIHYRVPMIGIPFLADQYNNVARIVKLGIGRRLRFEHLDSSTFNNSILDVITNPRYHENVAKLRDLIYDQPQSAIERSVWWTEYVIRHKGARHLKSPSTGMSWTEYYLIYDVLQILGCVVIAVTAVVYMIVFVVRASMRENKYKQS